MKQGTIGQTLQYLIEEKGITVKELSAATQIPMQTLYSMIKKTTNQTNIDNLLILANYFEKDIKIFFGVDKYEEPIVLSSEERTILNSYRKLNRFGRTRLEEEALTLFSEPRYTKSIDML